MEETPEGVNADAESQENGETAGAVQPVLLDDGRFGCPLCNGSNFISKQSFIVHRHRKHRQVERVRALLISI